MKQKTLLFLVCAFLCISCIQAQVITPSEALKRAQEFLAGKSRVQTRSMDQSGLKIIWQVNDTLELQEAGPLPLHSKRSSSEPLLYVIGKEQGSGYLILSGDDCAAPVLGYSTSASFDSQELPGNLREWLKGYAREITLFRASLPEGVVEDTQLLNEMQDWAAIPTMITTQWGQGEPYNQLCPTDGEGRISLSGCGPVALAQILAYYKKDVPRTQPFTWYSGNKGQYSSYVEKNVTVDFSTPIEWNALRDSYIAGEYTEKEAAAVATLMSYSGAALEAMYGPWLTTIYYHQFNKHISDFFGYDPRVYSLDRFRTNTSDWNRRIYEELKSGRPVAYGSGSGSHLFVCDGYSENGFFHMNFGWNGYQDGYYQLQAIRTNGLDCTGRQYATFNLCPETEDPLPEAPWLLSGLSWSKRGALAHDITIMVSTAANQTSKGRLRIILKNLDNPTEYSQSSPEIQIKPGSTATHPITLKIPADLADGTYSMDFYLARDNEEIRLLRNAVHLSFLLEKARNETTISTLRYSALSITCSKDETGVVPVEYFYKNEKNKFNVRINNPNKRDMEGHLYAQFSSGDEENTRSVLLQENQFIPNGSTSLNVSCIPPRELKTGTCELKVLFYHNGQVEEMAAQEIELREEGMLHLTESLKISPSNTIYCDQEFTISAKIRNNEDRNVSKTIYFKQGSTEGTWNSYLPVFFYEWEPHEEKTIEYSIHPHGKGALKAEFCYSDLSKIPTAATEIADSVLFFVKDEYTGIDRIEAQEGPAVVWDGSEIILHSSSEEITGYTVFTIQGQILQSGTSAIPQKEIRITPDATTAGICIVQIQTQKGIINKRITIR